MRGGVRGWPGSVGRRPETGSRKERDLKGISGSVRSVRLALVLTLLASIAVQASEVLGGYEGWLDRMGAGVRELGRGNTGTALQDAAPASYWNPAVLPFFRRTVGAAGAEIRSLDRNGGYLSLQGPVANNLGLGLSVVNRGDLALRAYDRNEVYAGTARPQAYATWLGAGIRTSRRNALGASLQLYASTLDIEGGIGDVDYVGGLNLGWYRRVSDSLSVAVVVRNLGFNGRLSSEFEQTVTGRSLGAGFDLSSSRDFFPKTLVVAAEWRTRLLDRPIAVAGEVLDFQLSNDLVSFDPGHHSLAARVGGEWEVAERTHVRLGLDRLNPTFGFGYAYRWSRARVIQFDYALILERGATTFNPYAAGIKTTF